MPVEDSDREMKTNHYGPFYCCEHFIRSRRIPRAGAAGYDVAKGGLRNLTRTLCLELAPVHINANKFAGAWRFPMAPPRVSRKCSGPARRAPRDPRWPAD
jgi:NAD(P)-dependent dehydrogenase (short-subunit alcohol dehydrogenase family)